MIKVSIIVPFHNVAKYISKCLTTLMYQTLEDIEIICINDASTDYSKGIVQKYAQNDNRIILLNTGVQSGQSYARNLGLEIASGEYIGFVDADDWCSLDMFEKLYNAAKEHDTDITMCAASLYDDTEQKFYNQDYYDLSAFKKFENSVFSSLEAKDNILDNPAVLWNKIYKNDFLLKNDIKFQQGYIYEDLPFAMETFIKAQKMNIVRENLYFYRQNRRFSTMTNSDKKVFDRIPMVELTYGILQKAPFFNEKKLEIICWAIDDIFHRYTLLEEKYYQDYYKNMKEFFIRLNNTIDDEMREILSSKSYSRDEFEAVINSSYFEFWGFLIEKYKSANKRIKETQHKCNQDVKAIKDYFEEYKEQQNKEKEQTINWWKEHTEKSVEDAVKVALDKQYTEIVSKKDDEMNERLVKQEYELKAWQEELVRQVKEKLIADYEWKLEEQRQHYQESFMQQKFYYENHYKLIKILFKFYKKREQLKNKLGRLLKKN